MANIHFVISLEGISEDPVLFSIFFLKFISKLYLKCRRACFSLKKRVLLLLRKIRDKTTRKKLKTDKPMKSARNIKKGETLKYYRQRNSTA
jgi:hypothetical protein